MDKEFVIYPTSYDCLQKKWSDGPNDPVHGYFDEMQSAIYVNSDLKLEMYERVLTHEITHAVLSISGLSELLKSNLEEAICTSMENLITLMSF